MLLHDFRRRLGRRHLLALVITVAAVFAVWFVPLASAHNSLITASLDCNGGGTYTATAWAGPSAASRTNTDVRVFRSIDNGTTWTQVGQGQFKSGNSFSFSGTFSVGSSRSVRLMVQEFANWGDGTHPAGPGYANATRPSNCGTTPPPTTTTTTTTTTPPPPPPPPTTTTTVTPPTPPPPVVTPPPPVVTPPVVTPPVVTPPVVPPPVVTAPVVTPPASTPVAPKHKHGVLGAVFKKAIPKAKPAKAVVAPAHFTG
jgi:hypothetical protein